MSGRKKRHKSRAKKPKHVSTEQPSAKMTDRPPILTIITSFIKDKFHHVTSIGHNFFMESRNQEGHKLCIQCRAPISPSSTYSSDDVCSEICAIELWNEFIRQCSIYSGETPPCKFPRCSKLCYVENSGRVHDFCGKFHADEYKKVKDAAERCKRGKGHHWGSGGHKLGSGSQRLENGGRQQAVQNQHGTVPSGYGYSNQTKSRYSAGPIFFYNRGEPYYEFTNFYREEIFLDECLWPTTEHYFQAQKFIGTPFVERIRKAFGPREAFEMSRDPSISRWRRSDWEEVKIDVMKKALFAKFTQIDYLKRRLLGTGNRMLVERSPVDSFWGDGGDGTGLNWLGRLLMDLRSKLQGEKIDDIQRDSIASSRTTNEMLVNSYQLQGSGSSVSSDSTNVGSNPPLSSNNEGLTRRGLHEPSTKSKEAPKGETGDLIDLSDQPSSSDQQLYFPAGDYNKPLEPQPVSDPSSLQHGSTEASPDPQIPMETEDSEKTDMDTE